MRNVLYFHMCLPLGSISVDSVMKFNEQELIIIWKTGLLNNFDDIGLYPIYESRFKPLGVRLYKKVL